MGAVVIGRIHWNKGLGLGVVWIAMAASTGLKAQVEIVAGPLFNSANAHEYFLLSPGGWTESESLAVSLGGHLVTIDDAAEQAWVFGTFGAWDGIQRSLWIGLSDAAVEGTFIWADGSPAGYSNWLAGQPDDSPVTNGEDFVHMLNVGNVYGHPGGYWNDLADANPGFETFNPICGVVELAAPFRPTLQISGLPLQLCWRARPGVRCRVEHRSRLDLGSWAEWMVVTADGSGQGCVAVTEELDEGQGYFRLVLE